MFTLEKLKFNMKTSNKFWSRTSVNFLWSFIKFILYLSIFENCSIKIEFKKKSFSYINIEIFFFIGSQLYNIVSTLDIITNFRLKWIVKIQQ